MSATGALSLSDLLPDYDVGEEIGRGAMGIVHIGRHRHLDRQVAIKELPASLIDDAEVRARFLSEARTLASLDHPNIVPVYDFVDRDGRCLLVMEALQGGTLWDRFTRDGMTIQTSVAVAIATSLGVDHAHANGVLHRDIKPENLLFASTSQLKVTDFGIAKVISGDRTMGTIDGSVLGTPAYMAPEQAEGETLGPTADVYAIGAVLFEFVCGRSPFEADSPMSLLVQRIMNDAPDVRSIAPNVPAPIAEVIARALTRDPDHRIASASTLASDLVEAGTAAWGADWLAAIDIDLVDLGRPSTSSLPRAAATVAPQSKPDTAPPQPEPQPQPQPANETVAPLRAKPESPTVRPQGSHVPALSSAPLARGDLVSLSTLIKPPPRRWPLQVAAVAATLLAGLLAFLAPSEPTNAGTQAIPAPTIDGIELDPGAVTQVSIDQPMLLENVGSAPGGVSVDYSGVPIWSSGGAIEGGKTEADLGPLGFAFSGPLSVTIGLDSANPATYVIRSDRPWYASAQGPVLLAIIAVAVSMLEFRLRSFRKGNVRVFMLIGTAATAAVFAAGSTALYSQYSQRTIDLAAIVPVAIVASVAGALVAFARANNARARRRLTTSAKLRALDHP